MSPYYVPQDGNQIQDGFDSEIFENYAQSFSIKSNPGRLGCEISINFGRAGTF